MKKPISLLAVFCMAAAANATILRVSNVEGSSAPYTSISDAISAAADGDTIMVDASATSYGTVIIAKRIALIGPGYLLNENNLSQISPAPALAESVEMNAEGAVMQGMTVEENVDIVSPKCVVNKCRINGVIALWGPHDEGKSGNAINCVIHQNLLNGRIEGDYNNSVYEPTISNALITNNIFTGDANDYRGIISFFKESTIAYNTWTQKTGAVLFYVFNSTINNNIFPLADKDSEDVDGRNSASRTNLNNARNNNEFLFYGTDGLKSFEWEALVSPFKGHTDTDLAIKAIEDELFPEAGAFSGDTPYVLSGVPAGPIVEDLVVPATVEKGSKLQVTIKVGIQQ